MERHLVDCSLCRELVSALVKLDPITSVPLVSRKLPGEARDESNLELAPGSRIGRYVLLDRLGEGGMGVVYSAQDSELDRKVALKLLRSNDLGPAHQDSLRERLRREAQVMAKIAHPNVVTVFDVGTWNECIFIAMELVEGHTLEKWLGTPRHWRAVMEKFLAAGHGLAAAHDAGIIHRDFKPANVFLGEDGRVRVGDFGLAFLSAGAAGSDIREDHGSPAPGEATAEPADSFTGTPFYMAPEQLFGSTADARSDQFSFCASLHIALTGRHPFAGQATREGFDPAEFINNLRSGRVNHALAQSNVPRSCSQAILQGLRPVPSERFPDMKALLARLSAHSTTVKRRIAMLVAFVFFVGGGAAYAMIFGNGAAPLDEARCSGGQSELAAVWNGGLADRLRTAFTATGRSHAASSASRVVERFDSYARDWTAMHRSVCQATARGEQSADLLDRRMACLSRRLSKLGALTDLFLNQVDRDVVDRAIDLTGGLDPVRACADSAALLSQIGPPTDPDRRARAAELEHRLARVDIDRLAGRMPAAASGARAVIEAEQALDYPPIAARAGRILGRALRDLGRPAEAREALLHAQRKAQRVGDVKLASYLLLELLVVVTAEYRHEEAQLLGQLLEATLERPDLRDDLVLRADFLEALGSKATDEGRFGPAIEYLREALATRRRIVPPVPENIATAQGNLARALSSAGFAAEARSHQLEAIATLERMLGEDHPKVALHHNNLGASYIEQDGNAVEARKHFLIALAILKKAPDFKAYPSVLNNLGELEREAGNYDQARQYHDAAIDLRRRRLGPDHPVVAMSRVCIGNLLRQTGHLEEALEQHRNALPALEKLGPKNPDHAECLSALGEDLRHLGRASEALQYQDRALKVLGSDGKPLLIGNAQVFQGLAQLDLGRREQAIPLLEQGLKAIPPTGLYRAQALFGLARALEPRYPASKRARQLGEEARAILTTMHRIRDRDEVAAYLKAQR